MDDRWSIGIHDWILTDGNYDTFEMGQTRQFAVEFHSTDFMHSDSPVKSAELIDKCTYRVNAVVAHIDENVWVLDFGIKAYDLRPGQVPPDHELPELGKKIEKFVSTLSVGQTVSCTLYLSVDHYAYMEFLCSKPNMIPLIYTWYIDKVNKQTGPYIREQDVYVVDEANAKWHEVESTNASLPERTGANELRCILLDIPPHADGEPLARWDEPEEQQSIRTMQPDELHRAIERYEIAASNLERFIAATKPPNDPADSEFISFAVRVDELPSLHEQCTQNPKSIDTEKIESLIGELDLKGTLETLYPSCLPAIVSEPAIANHVLEYVRQLKDRALKRLSELADTEPN